MKASDLRDEEVLIAVDRLSVGRIGACTWRVAEDAFPDAPEKVVTAKLRRLGKRGLINGCACGCRGDWNLTDAGSVLIDRPKVSNETLANTFGIRDGQGLTHEQYDAYMSKHR